MGELCYATELFKKRNRIVLRRRSKGAFGSDERPSALVVAHTITPAKKQQKGAATKNAVTVIQKPPDEMSCSVQGRLMDSVSFARTGATPSHPQQHLRDCRVAFENVRQAQFALLRTIEKLKRESNEPSKCIGDLRAILATLELNVPKLAQ